MKNLILFLVALAAFNSQARAAGTAQSSQLKKLVTHSSVSRDDTGRSELSEQAFEESKVHDVNLASTAETDAKSGTDNRPKIWDVRFFGRR